MEHISNPININKNFWLCTKVVKFDTSTEQLETSTQQFNLGLLQWMVSNWKTSTEHIRTTRKKINIKKIRVHMLIRASKIPQERQKKYVMVMFVCMNVVDNSFVQRMKPLSQQRICLSVICRRLRQSKNIIIKTWHNLRTFITENWKYVRNIWNRELWILRTLWTLPSINQDLYFANQSAPTTTERFSVAL